MKRLLCNEDVTSSCLAPQVEPWIRIRMSNAAELIIGYKLHIERL